MSFTDVMLDIETMSLHPSNALILSIGLVEFDPTLDEAIRFGERTLIKPDITMQLLHGREVDPQTQKFWQQQPREAQIDWMQGERDSLTATSDLIAGITAGKTRLWANGIVFDIGNVASLIRQIGHKEPWHYRAPRDMRTFCLELPQTRVMEIGDALDLVDGKEGVPHTAVYDCISQAHRVWQHWPKQ